MNDTPHWSDPSWRERFPQLSLAERDRRLRLAREVMDAMALDALVLSSPAHSHDFIGHYFAGEHAPTVVVPRGGDPVAFQDGVTNPFAARDLAAGDEHGDRWIADWRINEGAAGIAAHLRALGLGDARIGATGRAQMWPTSAYVHNVGAAWNTLPLAHDLAARLPAASWADPWATLLPLVSVKSDEEIAQFAKAAHLTQRASEIFLDVLDGGGTQADAMADAAVDVLAHGGYTPSAGTSFVSGAPVAPTDVVTSEICTYVGDTEVQSGMTVCRGSASRSVRTLVDAALESYRLGRAAIAPGLAMRELQEIMEEPFRRISAWHTAPLFQGLNPIYLQGETGHVDEGDLPGLRARFFPDRRGELPYHPVFAPDMRFRAGMTVNLEPSAQKGVDSVFLGSSLLVTDDGNEEYGSILSRAKVTPLL